MGRRTIRKWQRIPCPECRGIGIVTVHNDIHSSENLVYGRCTNCHGDGMVTISLENRTRNRPINIRLVEQFANDIKVGN